MVQPPSGCSSSYLRCIDDHSRLPLQQCRMLSHYVKKLNVLAAAPAELPLWGRRILVTGPRQYAGRLAAPLAAAGARVVAMPCIAIQRLEDAEQLQVRLEYAVPAVPHLCGCDQARDLGMSHGELWTVEGTCRALPCTLRVLCRRSGGWTTHLLVPGSSQVPSRITGHADVTHNC